MILIYKTNMVFQLKPFYKIGNYQFHNIGKMKKK